MDSKVSEEERDWVNDLISKDIVEGPASLLIDNDKIYFKEILKFEGESISAFFLSTVIGPFPVKGSVGR